MSAVDEQQPVVAGVDPARVAAVERAQKVWTGQLVDLGGRNTLLYYRDLKVGTLDLSLGSAANPIAVEKLLGSYTVALSELFAADNLPDAVKRARTIRAKATENFEERGLRTLFLAWGMATWTNARSASVPAAPVLLRQANLAPRGRAEESFELSLPDEWEVNPTLLYALEQDFQVKVDSVDLLGLIDLLDGGAGAPDPTALFERLAKAASAVPGFSVTNRVVLGNFSYAKWEMVNDLKTGTDALLASELLCAIAGYEPAGQAIRDRQVPAELSEPDRVPPADEFLVLDADASQSYVINAVVRGSDLVVQGPPGTGKSQTIANLIATLAARGKKVLFVAEKRAAIDAVMNRLSERGLADLVLDLHDGVASKRKLAQDLARTLAEASSIGLPDVAELQQTLVRRRADLVRHNDSLHSRRQPWGISVYEAQSRSIAIPDTFRSRLRLRGPALESLDFASYDRARQALRAYANLGGLRLSAATSPWARALAAGTIATPAEAQAALNAVSGVWGHTWPQTSARLSHLLTECGLRPPEDLATWASVLTLLDGVAATLNLFTPAVYNLPLAELAAAMGPAAKGGSRFFGSIFNGAFRSAKRQLRSTLKPGAKVPSAQLLQAVTAATGQAARWAQLSADGGPPRLPTDLNGVQGAYKQLCYELRALDAYVGGPGLDRMAIDGLGERLAALTGDTETLGKLPELGQHRAALWRYQLGPLVEELTARNLDVDGALAALESVWVASILDHLTVNDPIVGSFDGTAADRNVVEFITADKAHIASGPQRVRRAVAERITAVRDQFPNQSQLVVNQASRMRKFTPMRELYQAAPDVLGALKPCWAMSPLVVSQLLPMTRCFDVAIFDEASQVTPQEAAGVIARAERVVVAGDPKQLPPTAFFAPSGGGVDDEDAEAALDRSLLSDVESVLDQVAALLPPPAGTRTLGWHYRSRDERLIAFSNAQESLYDYGMTTFPGPGIEDPIRHVHVPWRAGRPGEEDSAADEVNAVIKLIAEHAHTRPDESLGVIAMGIKHANRIQETLRLARQGDDVLDAFATGQASPAALAELLFVKNLERVQGDERDAIILTVGYTKSADGRMMYRFGPLNNDGGERRLNVAVTRARRRMTVVSSFTSTDLDPTKLRAEGARMLGRYLAYAESAGTNLGDAAKDKPDLNPFERDVEAQLTKAGIPLIAQWGCSGYWIDYVAQHPTQPGRMVLAIECDGVTYHSSATARDRDRLRQEHLERLGWRFHRIWSTEWFRHRDAEIQRAVAAYRSAVAQADTARPVAAPVEVSELETEPATPADATRKGQMPVQPRLGSIEAYSHPDLVALIRWIESDTLLRTQEQLLAEAVTLLGFKRRGSKIVDALQWAIAEARKPQRG
ncbi:MAG: AAA domain-containing protein [Actinomycetota bacterium]|nr:AAA domain-containing protein [Actinomycetota bacterium]